MFQNYLKIALRTLSRNKAYTAINVIGLAMGLACCVLITLYVQDELSFDRFHANADRIYRMDGDIRFQGQSYNLAVVPAPMGETMQQELPEVQAFMRFRPLGTYLVKSGEKTFREERVSFADEGFFTVFSANAVQGNGYRALSEPNTLVITEELARKYFGAENPLGKRLLLDNKDWYTVGAVMKAFPTTSHIRFDMLLSMTSHADSKQPVWVSNNYSTYILLRPGASADAVNAKLTAFVERHLGKQVKELMNTTMEQFRAAGNNFYYRLVPLTSIHLYSGVRLGELSPNGSAQYVWIFSGVAVFVLLIACVNFMNLSTARAAKRAKEVGIRKTLGSRRSLLVGQFMGESALLVFFALIVAVCIVEASLPAFNALSGKELTYAQLHTPLFAGLLLALYALVSLLASLYPAFVLSAFQPVKVLKGAMSQGSRHSAFRSVLVIFQFASSVVLVIGTMVIFNQLRYVQSKSLGFKREQVLVVKDTWTLGETAAKTFKQELQKITGVQTVAATNYLPTNGVYNDNITWTGGEQPTNNNSMTIQQWAVSAEYIKTLGMEIVNGRDFNATFASDSNTVILNESAARRFFGAQSPLGKVLHTGIGANNPRRSYTVIGVVRDFHFRSLREKIEPLALFMGNNYNAMSIRFEAANASAIVAQVEATWKRIAPDKPFEFGFMDAQFDSIYRTEQRTGTILGVFTALAIVIACLGLFGLAAFMAEARTKEVGVRKVLGATEANIIALLSKDFLKLVGVAFIAACPLAWWAMSAWLQNFSYRVELSADVFVLAGVLAVMVAFATVAGQAWRAARANPVKALKYE